MENEKTQFTMEDIVMTYISEKIEENKKRNEILERIFKILESEDLLIVSHNGANYVYLSDRHTFLYTETFIVRPSVMYEYYNYLQVFKDAIGKLYKINPQKFKEVLEILLELI